MDIGPPEIPSQRVTQLVARLDESTLASAEACNVCGFEGWRPLPDTLRVDGAEMLAYYCRECGFVRLHYVVPFEVVTRAIEEEET
jgi:hypothetical protein